MQHDEIVVHLDRVIEQYSLHHLLLHHEQYELFEVVRDILESERKHQKLVLRIANRKNKQLHLHKWQEYQQEQTHFLLTYEYPDRYISFIKEYTRHNATEIIAVIDSHLFDETISHSKTFLGYDRNECFVQAKYYVYNILQNEYDVMFGMRNNDFTLHTEIITQHPRRGRYDER